MYDVTNRESLLDVQHKWMSEFRTYGTYPAAVQMLVANKVDLVGGQPWLGWGCRCRCCWLAR